MFSKKLIFSYQAVFVNNNSFLSDLPGEMKVKCLEKNKNKPFLFSILYSHRSYSNTQSKQSISFNYD